MNFKVFGRDKEGDLVEMEGTREEILKIVKKKEGVTIPDLIKDLGIYANAVRGHLAILEKEGMLETRWVKQTRGRPRKFYRLSERAEGFFPKKYEHLLEELITEIHGQEGPERLGKLIRSMSSRWAGTLKPAMQGQPFDKVMEALVGQLDLGGMIPSLRKEKDGFATTYYISVFNCVYRQTALKHKEVCTIIPSLIKELAGADVFVEKSIREGCGHCVYVVSPPE